MKHTRVVSTKCTPGFACRAFSDTTLVCFIVNEHTTKCSRYIITSRIPVSIISILGICQHFDKGQIRNTTTWTVNRHNIYLYEINIKLIGTELCINESAKYGTMGLDYYIVRLLDISLIKSDLLLTGPKEKHFIDIWSKISSSFKKLHWKNVVPIFILNVFT